MPITLPEALLRPLDDADHAGLADAGHHLVATEGFELVGNDAGGPMHVVEDLGVLMDIATPLRDLVVHGGNAVDDGHWGSFDLSGTML